MKRKIYAALAGLALALTSPLRAQTDFDWVAPEPPLPNTQHWDYGWDSTSNGVPPGWGGGEARVRQPRLLAQAGAVAYLPQPPHPANHKPAIPVKAESKPLLASLSVNPYATWGFEDFDGKSEFGAGLEAAVPLTKSVSFIPFAESDDWQHAAIDRAGAGLQFTGKLGPVRPFGRIGAGYTWDRSSALDENVFFLRPQFGATLPLYKSGDFEAGLTASWALDVDLNGNAAQRLFGGLALSYKF